MFGRTAARGTCWSPCENVRRMSRVCVCVFSLVSWSSSLSSSSSSRCRRSINGGVVNAFYFFSPAPTRRGFTPMCFIRTSVVPRIGYGRSRACCRLSFTRRICPKHSGDGIEKQWTCTGFARRNIWAYDFAVFAQTNLNVSQAPLRRVLWNGKWLFCNSILFSTLYSLIDDNTIESYIVLNVNAKVVLGIEWVNLWINNKVFQILL